MASALHPDSVASLPLVQRVQAFFTMVEGKAMHSAQVADLHTKAVDAYVNKDLKAVVASSALPSSAATWEHSLPSWSARVLQRRALLTAA